MIGIFNDSFLKYLEDNDLEPKVTSKNIIIKCPWCEYGKDKDHYHMHISLEAPIFHCFHATCEQKGILKKLIKKIEGHEISNDFVNIEKLEEFEKKRTVFIDGDKSINVYLPPIDEDKFINKQLYLKKRFKFANISMSQVKGLIFDIDDFFKNNNIQMNDTLTRLKDYLHSNFIGFLSENQCKVIFRNIDDEQSMRYFKLTLKNELFNDYYKINGGNPNSNQIVLAEGIFDIFSASLFDILNLRNSTKTYASVLSSKYASLIQSLVFHEQIFRPDVVILSDNGIPLSQYKKLRKFNNHIINSLTVYYNKAGKDFNDTPVIPVKEVITI